MTTGTPQALPTRPFGVTNLQVTPISIGCAPLGSMEGTFGYSVPEDRALEFVRAIFKHPINFIDTAASYGDGESERRIGLVLRELGGLPSGYVLATKADRDLKTGDFSGEQMKRSVERSLKLLGMERLQIVYLHDPEHSTFEEITAPKGAIEVLQDLKAQGVIEHLGIAGGPFDLMMRYVETGAFEALITHNRFTLLNQSAEPLIEMAAQRGLAVMNAAPYGSGILAKGVAAYPRYAYQEVTPKLYQQTQQLEDICREYNIPIGAAALQFSLRDTRITSTIIGMTRPERLDQTLELANHPIPDEVWGRLAAIQPSREDPEKERWAS